MGRRLALAFVSLATLTLLAGCGTAGSIDVRASQDALVDGASRSFDPDGDPPRAEPSAWQVATEAIEANASVVTAASPPLAEGLPVAHDGAFYDVISTVADTRSGHAVDVGVDYNASSIGDADGDGTPGEVVAFADLPAPDRAIIGGLLPPPIEPRETPGPDLGVGATYTDAELNASVLAPTQRYDAVRYDSEGYPIHLDDVREVTLRTVRYEAHQVAPNESAFAAQVRDEYDVGLVGLSDREREIVEEAIGDGAYHAESADDQAFRSLLERFRAHRAVVETETDGTWVVRYEGEVYLAELRYGGFT